MTTETTKTRKERNRNYNAEDVAFVFDNYAEHTTEEMAEARELSLSQITSITSKLRKAGVALPKKANRKGSKRVTAISAFLQERPDITMVENSADADADATEDVD